MGEGKVRGYSSGIKAQNRSKLPFSILAGIFNRNVGSPRPVVVVDDQPWKINGID
jgi:hypothetical protein